MRFDRWIETQGGTKGIAEKFNIERHRVHQWVRRNNAPQAKVMQRLVNSSRGKLSYDDIIDFATKKKKAKTKKPILKRLKKKK